VADGYCWYLLYCSTFSQVVSLSVAQGVPCAYTRMVGFETTGAKYNQLQVRQCP
jgi:hypothetical protein